LCCKLAVAEGLADGRAKLRGMTEHETSRTLVKSPPELWAECSDSASLGRHLEEFGEIRITRLEPETAVAWEGERASGTVRIEQSGWGTRVTLTAQTTVEDAAPPVREVAAAEAAVLAVEEEAAEEPAAVSVEEPATVAVAAAALPPQRPRGRLRTLMRTWLKPTSATAGPVPVPVPVPADVGPQPKHEPAVAVVEPVRAPDPAPAPEPAREPAPEPVPSVDPHAVLTAALDSLGQAHHRPFSRA
jgi:hypothetical protein